MNKLQFLFSNKIFDDFASRHEKVDRIFHKLPEFIAWLGFVFVYPLSYHYAATLDYGYTFTFTWVHALVNFFGALLITTIFLQLGMYLLCFLYGYLVYLYYIIGLFFQACRKYF